MRFPLFLLILALAACGPEPATVQNGMNAYQQNRIGDAERIFAAVLADSAAPAGDKAAAARESARILWLIDRDEARALEALESAEAESPCFAFLLRDRILADQGKSDRVLALLPAQLERCTEPDQRERLRLAGARAALFLGEKGDAAALARSRALLAEAGEDAGRGLAGSAIRLELGLLAGDPSEALQGWKDYFWLSDKDAPQGLAAGPVPVTQVFADGLAAGAEPRARLALVDILVRAGFARAAERFASLHRLGAAAGSEPLWRKASAYFAERRKLEDVILASNRRVARGGSAGDLAGAVEAMEQALMKATGLSGEPKAALRRAYGLYGTVGDTGGFTSVHLGHVVQDERLRVDQYGHHADVGFLAVDNMLSNGFQSWLWDGSAAAGGWTADGPVIVQVRPEYVSDPLTGWREADGEGRRKLLERQKARAATDVAALAASDVAFLPGLADRLRLQVADQVMARARALAGEGGDVRRAFLDEYWRALLQQSITVHEGRHALDKTLIRGFARFNDMNLEYRAKLSELALCDYPRLALYNINVATIGGDAPHDKANARIMRAYGEWMEANRAAVAGLDPKLPLLAQLDKLSDAQIRAVARSLDPLAG